MPTPSEQEWLALMAEDANHPYSEFPTSNLPGLEYEEEIIQGSNDGINNMKVMMAQMKKLAILNDLQRICMLLH